MSEQFMAKVLEVSGDFIKNINNVAPDVVKEITNYFIFLSALSVAKNLLFLVLVAGFYRFMSSQIMYLESEKKTYKEENLRLQFSSTINIYRFIKVAGSLVSGFLIMNNVYPNVETIGKALFAPKVFIIEKAHEILNSQKK